MNGFASILVAALVLALLWNDAAAQEPVRRDPTVGEQPVGPASGRGVRVPVDGAGREAGTRDALDRELVLDAGALTSVYREAMQPLQETLRETTLDQRYRTLADMLQSDKVDGEALIGALSALREELDRFVTRLPGVEGSLWDGAEDLGARIDDFRRVLARDLDREELGGPVRSKATESLLRELADRILSLPENSQERRILEQRFEALSLLLDRTEQAMPDLGGADQKVLRHVLEFLVNIRASLHVAALRTSELSIAMRRQRQLIGKFEMLIENLRATDQLADTIEELTSRSAPTFTQLTQHMETLTEGLLNYTDQLDARAAEVAASLAPQLGGSPEAGTVLPREELMRRIRAAATDVPPATREATEPARTPLRVRGDAR
ncbi:MAG: hypothetical protein IPM29_00180 [Planctomycetes bacterium]|nr:hypothetical protein [Planctomycetota bacterium]